jgi:hypothetical protein
MLRLFFANTYFNGVWNLSDDCILIPWSLGPVGYRDGTDYDYPVWVAPDVNGVIGFWVAFINYWNSENDTATMINILIALRTNCVWLFMY